MRAESTKEQDEKRVELLKLIQRIGSIIVVAGKRRDKTSRKKNDKQSDNGERN